MIIMKRVQGYQYMAFEWSLVATTFIIVLIRLYVRVHLYGSLVNLRSWRWSEFFVVVGWLLFLGTTICDQLSVESGGKKEDGWSAMTAEHKTLFLKVEWAWSFMYKPAIYSMKASLLCFYMELIAPIRPRIRPEKPTNSNHRKLRIAIIVTAVWNALGLIAQLAYITFQCVPFRKQWDIYNNSCANVVAYPAVTWSFHVFTDILVYALPFVILRSVLYEGRGHEATTFRQYSGALFMFGLGTINLLSAIVLFSLRMLPENFIDTPTDSTSVAINFLYTLQISTAIVLPCCPQIRVFFKQMVGRYRLSNAPAAPVGTCDGSNTLVSWRTRYLKLFVPPATSSLNEAERGPSSGSSFDFPSELYKCRLALKGF